MAIVETLLPRETVYGFTTERSGPIEAEDFERWPQEPDNPMELIEGWVMPMSPGNYLTGRTLPELYVALRALVEEHGWEMLLDARHVLPAPRNTVVFPDLAIHCTGAVQATPELGTVHRAPDLVIELLGKETADRDKAPRGAKFLAYQMSGVREYYYSWPDGREAAGFRLEGGSFLPLPADSEGFFASPLLGARFRPVPPALRR